MLLSYFVQDPDFRKLALIGSILSRTQGLLLDFNILEACINTILTDFKQKYASFSGASVCLGIDELSKSKSAEDILSLVCTAMDHANTADSISVVVTGLEIAPFVSVTKKSNRSINYIAIPLLSKSASRSLVNSFLPRLEGLVSGKNWNDALNYIAISSGGHPRSLEWICAAINSIIIEDRNDSSRLIVHLNNNVNVMLINISLILATSTKLIPSHCLLSKIEEIDTIIINNVVTRDQVLENKVISNAIAEGRFFATLNESIGVDISVSPLVLRASILSMQNILPELKELLVTSGFRDYNVDAFRQNNKQHGKLYEQFHLIMEKIRRRTLAKFHTSVPLVNSEIAIYPQCSARVGTLAYGFCTLLNNDFITIELPDKNRASFPSEIFKQNIAEGLTIHPDDIKKAIIDLSAGNLVFYPKYECQKAYDFLLLTFEVIQKKPIFIAVEASYSSGNAYKEQEAFINRFRTKCKLLNKLGWKVLGVKAHKDVVHLFVTYADLTSGREDWIEEVSNYKLGNAIVLDINDLKKMYGGLFALFEFL
jgi:hypothetical protein